jgi:GT2 family glycosyltransferase
MSQVDVSVIIPTFRRERQVVEAVRSALKQKGVTVEVLVLDDSGEASARTAVESIKDERVRYIARQVPTGGKPALVRNEGAKLASGRYLHFLDDDDMLEEGVLCVLMRRLEETPAAGMAFGVIVPFGDDPTELKREQIYFQRAARVARKLRSVRQLVINLLFYPSVLVNSACMARRAIFEELGGYDPDIPLCEDVELWARIARNTGFVFLDQPVVRFRTGAPALMHGGASLERLGISYRKMKARYRARHGILDLTLMRILARVIRPEPLKF